jgi:mono/diheme cytochrome c family protein
MHVTLVAQYRNYITRRFTNMRRFIQHLFILGTLAAAFVAAIPPVTPVSAAVKGSESKGRYYFRGTCKSCHSKGAVGGEITPLNKTQAQWKTYFASGKHAKGKEVLTKFMTEDQLRDVSAFLDAHAADSLQPETCGK